MYTEGAGAAERARKAAAAQRYSHYRETLDAGTAALSDLPPWTETPLGGVSEETRRAIAGDDSSAARVAVIPVGFPHTTAFLTEEVSPGEALQALHYAVKDTRHPDLLPPREVLVVEPFTVLNGKIVYQVTLDG